MRKKTSPRFENFFKRKRGYTRRFFDYLVYLFFYFFKILIESIKNRTFKPIKKQFNYITNLTLNKIYKIAINRLKILQKFIALSDVKNYDLSKLSDIIVFLNYVKYLDNKYFIINFDIKYLNLFKHRKIIIDEPSYSLSEGLSTEFYILQNEFDSINLLVSDIDNNDDSFYYEYYSDYNDNVYENYYFYNLWNDLFRYFIFFADKTSKKNFFKNIFIELKYYLYAYKLSLFLKNFYYLEIKNTPTLYYIYFIINKFFRKMLKRFNWFSSTYELFFGNIMTKNNHIYFSNVYSNFFVWSQKDYRLNSYDHLFKYNYPKGYVEYDLYSYFHNIKLKPISLVFWGEVTPHYAVNKQYRSNIKKEIYKSNLVRELYYLYLTIPFWLEKNLVVLICYIEYYRRMFIFSSSFLYFRVLENSLVFLHLFIMGARLKFIFMLNILVFFYKYLLKCFYFFSVYLNNFFFSFYKKNFIKSTNTYNIYFKFFYLKNYLNFKKFTEWKHFNNLLNQYVLNNCDYKPLTIVENLETFFYNKKSNFVKSNYLSFYYEKINQLIKLKVLNKLTNKFFVYNPYLWYIDFFFISLNFKSYYISSIKHSKTKTLISYYPYNVMGDYDNCTTDDYYDIARLNYKIKPGILTLNVTGGYYWENPIIPKNLINNKLYNVINDGSNYFAKVIYRGLISIWKLFSTVILCALFLIIFLISFLFFKSIIISQICFLVICLFYFVYLLISGFVYFVKKNKFGKYTSVIQRFWRRSFIVFWLIEMSLFLVFLYLILNASSESINTLDNMQIYKLHLFSWRFFLVKNFFLSLIILFTIILLNCIKTMYYNKVLKILLTISLLIFYLCWVEFYQFYHTLCYYANYIWFYDNEERIWSICLDIKQTRTFNSYYNLCIILKFWHLAFIAFFWFFFLMRSFEDNRIRYPLLSANCQNFLILYVMSWLCMIFWVKYVIKNFMEGSYSWFFINMSKETVKFFLADFFLIFKNIIIDFYEIVIDVLIKIIYVYYYKNMIVNALKNFFLSILYIFNIY